LQQQKALGKHCIVCFQNVKLITISFCKFVRSTAEVKTFDVVNQGCTIRYETIVEGEAPMFTNMCLQTEIFKYSNLIKTKKNHQNRKPENFLYIFDQILQKEANE